MSLIYANLLFREVEIIVMYFDAIRPHCMTNLGLVLFCNGVDRGLFYNSNIITAIKIYFVNFIQQWICMRHSLHIPELLNFKLAAYLSIIVGAVWNACPFGAV